MQVLVEPAVGIARHGAPFAKRSKTFSVALLTADEVLIGRKTDADIILSNPYISRHHAKLVKSQQGYKIIDLNSNHGTYLNGLRITQQELQSGDRISLGRDRVELVYSTGEGDTTTMAAVPTDDNVTQEPKG